MPLGWQRIWQTIQREGAYQIITGGKEPRAWYRQAHLPSMILKASQILWAEAEIMRAFATEAEKGYLPQDRLGQNPRTAKLLSFPGPVERLRLAQLKAEKLLPT